MIDSPMLGPAFPPNPPRPRGPYAAVVRRPGAGRKPSGRWARGFDRCRRCGSDAETHVARGLCQPCYRLSRQGGVP